MIEPSIPLEITVFDRAGELGPVRVQFGNDL
jgi:hypothetical protein